MKRSAAIKLRVTIEDDSALFDFSGTAPVLPGNLNANPSIVTSAVLYCLRCLIDEDIPLNSGVLEPVKIVHCPLAGCGGFQCPKHRIDNALRCLNVSTSHCGASSRVHLERWIEEAFGQYDPDGFQHAPYGPGSSSVAPDLAR